LPEPALTSSNLNRLANTHTYPHIPTQQTMVNSLDGDRQNHPQDHDRPGRKGMGRTAEKTRPPQRNGTNMASGELALASTDPRFLAWLVQNLGSMDTSAPGGTTTTATTNIDDFDDSDFEMVDSGDSAVSDVTVRGGARRRPQAEVEDGSQLTQQMLFLHNIIQHQMVPGAMNIQQWVDGNSMLGDDLPEHVVTMSAKTNDSKSEASHSTEDSSWVAVFSMDDTDLAGVGGHLSDVASPGEMDWEL
jgi:hypothetical protein